MINDHVLEFIVDAERLTWENYYTVVHELIEQYYKDSGNIPAVYRKIYACHIAVSEIMSTFSKQHQSDLLLLIFDYETFQSQRKPSDEVISIVDKIIDFLLRHGFFSYTRKTKLVALKKFLILLVDYKELHDWRNMGKRLKYNSWHPGHLARREEGLYPLSRNKLRKMHGHYNEVLPILIKAGIIERSNYGYWARKGNGICLYYKINIEKFSK